jgi:hypothetical protein
MTESPVVNNININNPSTIDASIDNFTSIMREIADLLFSYTTSLQLKWA